MKKIIITILILCLNGCWYPLYKIKIDNTEEFKSIIVQIEQLTKRIEVLPDYSNRTFAAFRFDDYGHLELTYSTTNYDSNDSIREGRSNPNQQKYVDSCKIIPGLTVEEWNTLKVKLELLHSDFGVKKMNFESAKNKNIEFFYYSYLYPEDWEYRDIGYLALLSEDIVSTEDFKQKFKIMDEKDGIYMIKLIR